MSSSSKRTTISDVAKVAGVSPATVSRVLNKKNGDIKISAATSERILKVAKSLDYQPNMFASALRTERTGILGAITRDISAVFLSIVARALQIEAHQRGIELLIGHAEQDLDVADRQLNIMRNRWFDGLIIIGDIPDYQSLIRNLKTNNQAFLSVAAGCDISPPFINVDEYEGVNIALDYLYALGHRKMATIGNEKRAGVADRMVYFQNYLEEHQLQYPGEYIQNVPITRNDARQAVKRLLQLPHPPTAIFCATDIQAIGAIAGALELGWKIPQEISIIGFDDINEAEDIYPALTTIRQPVKEMAKAALDLLIELIEDGRTKKRIILVPELVRRQSCGPPRADK